MREEEEEQHSREQQQQRKESESERGRKYPLRERASERESFEREKESAFLMEKVLLCYHCKQKGAKYERV
tara:strand:+ start:207 stop:416 length:210 start_codon:yes stop_codon:yes gene_type:complete